ncbi:globin domain-containing protein [Streptomyces sp. C10-9-1]|uniref:globin domain-containing protein n=1 Tax=Streptomyces sp. C10-9-1 TaxID=1859285 RepID=UPI00211362C7|nr:globin domain-containing protein [Streptomyces sp. C10-9-1]MCQ6553211.1 globin domain-containing protein [Streptomyces sp. C10-9-1]
MTTADYHALLARQEAMHLRKSLLTAPAAPAPGRPAPRAGTPSAVADPYSGGGHDSAHDQWLITRQLPLVLPLDRLIAHLYDAMFERHPSLRALFPDSMDFQRAHLERAFRYLVENLHRPVLVTAYCAALGRDHRRLGVRPAHLAVFEEALAQGLRRSAGAAWTPELEAAWLRMLRCGVAAMVAGAEAAAGEPTHWNAEVTGHRVHHTGGGTVAVLRVRPSEPYAHRAGQYASLQSPMLPQTWRPYALADAPRPDGELEFHVRAAGAGGVGEALALHTRPGDTLRLGPARGTMTLDDADLAERDVLAVAAGTGWATAKALLEDLAARRVPGRAAHLLLVGARTRGDLYDAQALERLEARCPWLRVTCAAPGEELPFHRGWADCTAYVGGPPSVVEEVLRTLTGHGLPAHRVHRDPRPPKRTRPPGPHARVPLRPATEGPGSHAPLDGVPSAGLRPGT